MRRPITIALALWITVGAILGVQAQSGPFSAQIQRLLHSDNTWTGVQTFSGGTITTGNTVVTGQIVSNQATLVTAAAAAFTVDFDNSNVTPVQLISGAQTATLSNPISGGRYLIKLIQPAGGAAGTVTWPAEVHWPGAVAPTLTTTNSQVDLVSLYWDGTTYFAEYGLNYAP